MENEKNNFNNQKVINFPDGFLWGTSASAYQTEGGNINDWSEWEKSEPRLKKLMKQGKLSSDYICAQACDSYNHHQEDLDLAKTLNNNAIRVGFEWSRIEPKKDYFDVATIQHYKMMLQEAKKRGLTTMATLWHWTNPLWFSHEGGWKNKKSIDYFTKYVDLIVKELGGEIDLWTTMNEPMTFIGFSYIIARHPPAKKWRFFTARKILNNLAAAHKSAYKAIHYHFPQAKVSFNCMTDYFEPLVKWDPFHIFWSKMMSYFHHKKFLNKTKKYLDFIALNYYHHNRTSYIPPFKFNKNEKVNDMGWEIYPEGIYHVLKFFKSFKNVPIYITENGIADEDDDLRPQFIIDHLKYIHQAIAEGINVRGYFYWSLLDNFEWAHGFKPKFGLYRVDRVTFARTPRPSAAVYAEICKNNGIVLDSR